MASIARKRDDKASSFKHNKPRFFKIILHDAIRHNGKLSLPRKFVREYGNNLSSQIVLKVCNGARWQVELIKCDGEIWIQKGWQEFVEYYSIAYGYLLVFEYENNCQLNVLIFDKTTFEIDYPLSNINGGDDEEHNLDKELRQPNVEKTKNDAFVEILDEEESPLPSFQPSKKISLENSAEEFEAKECNISMSSEKENVNKGISTRTQSSGANRKANSLRRARKSFKSNNPFFMVAMQPSYVHGGTQLSIPAKFARNYFKNTRGDVIVSDRDGKAWPARYVIYGKSSIIDNGWKKFSQENQLKVGDVCVFELINHSEINLKVVIFRDIEHSDSSLSIGNKKELKHERSSNALRVIKASKKFTSVNPFFKIVLRPCYLKHKCVAVPLIFFSKFTKKNKEDIILEIGSRRWHVKLIKYPSYNKCQFSAGWNSFAVDNSLQHGDVAKFELISAKNCLLKVSIFRNAN